MPSDGERLLGGRPPMRQGVAAASIRVSPPGEAGMNMVRKDHPARSQLTSHMQQLKPAGQRAGSTCEAVSRDANKKRHSGEAEGRGKLLLQRRVADAARGQLSTALQLRRPPSQYLPCPPLPGADCLSTSIVGRACGAKVPDMSAQE